MRDYYEHFITRQSGRAENLEHTPPEQVAKVAKPPLKKARRGFGGFATSQGVGFQGSAEHLDYSSAAIPEPLVSFNKTEKCYNGDCPEMLIFQQGRAYCRRCDTYQRVVS